MYILPAKAPVIIGQNDRMLAKNLRGAFLVSIKKVLFLTPAVKRPWKRRHSGNSVKERRCIIPATGFYEWSEKKDKYFFRSPDHRVLLFAGFYRQYEGSERFVILTTQANALSGRNPSQDAADSGAGGSGKLDV